MMKFEKAKSLDNEKFRRLTGVKRSTCDQMVSILEISHKIKKAGGGRVNKLKIEDHGEEFYEQGHLFHASHLSYPSVTIIG